MAAEKKMARKMETVEEQRSAERCVQTPTQTRTHSYTRRRGTLEKHYSRGKEAQEKTISVNSSIQNTEKREEHERRSTKAEEREQTAQRRADKDTALWTRAKSTSVIPLTEAHCSDHPSALPLGSPRLRFSSLYILVYRIYFFCFDILLLFPRPFPSRSPGVRPNSPSRGAQRSPARSTQRKKEHTRKIHMRINKRRVVVMVMVVVVVVVNDRDKYRTHTRTHTHTFIYIATCAHTEVLQESDSQKDRSCLLSASRCFC